MNHTTYLATILLCVFGLGRASAQDDSPQLRLSRQADHSLLFRLVGVPADDEGLWILQSSASLDGWEDLAALDKKAGAGADLEFELAVVSMPQAGAAQQFFRARYLSADDPLLREFLVNRDKWRTAGFDSYTIETNWFLSMFVWQGTVRVRNGEVASSETIFTNFFEPPEPKTIDDWFDHLKRFIDQEADSIIVTYDPVFGYPKSVSIDESVMIADEEQSWSILSLQPER